MNIWVRELATINFLVIWLIIAGAFAVLKIVRARLGEQIDNSLVIQNRTPLRLMNIGEQNEAESGFERRRGKGSQKDSDRYRKSDDLGASFYQLVFHLLFLRQTI